MKISKKGNLGDTPLMTLKEISCVVSYLDKNSIMLEWGAGGSTVYFPKFVKKYYSIEHDKDFFLQVKDRIEKFKRYDNVYMNLAKVKKVDKYPYCDDIFYKNYINYIEKFGEKRFDAILIDGRSRKACALAALKYMDEKSVLFIHDYYHNLDTLYGLEEYFDIIKSIGKNKIPRELYGRRNTLVVMRKKI